MFVKFKMDYFKEFLYYNSYFMNNKLIHPNVKDNNNFSWSELFLSVHSGHRSVHH